MNLSIMEINKSCTLPKKFVLNNKYKVGLFIKQGKYAETYRLKGNDGRPHFLKLIDYAKLPRSSFNDENNLLEIELLRSISHQNIVSYEDHGELIFEGRKFGYLILDFLSGETLEERLSRKTLVTIYDVRQIIKGILAGLSYLHSLPDPIIHNEISPRNIMLDLSGNAPCPKIIDFGYARLFHQSTKSFNKEGLNLEYVASECFNNLYSPQSDLFSVGALMYHLIFGVTPWHKEISRYQSDRKMVENIIMNERKKPLAFPNMENEIIDFDDLITRIVKKALSYDPSNRFQTANEFIQAIDGELEINEFKESKEATTRRKEARSQSSGIKDKRKGFDAIAGMKKLKEQLKYDVIDVLENPDEYKKYNVGLPNGILLYGPPGCGKTFFAEKFAEETGYNFMKIVSSDLASIYIHGTQEKIAKVFNTARENAPTILYFTEINSMVPDRDEAQHSSVSGEVNEFLSQLDNIGDSGVFVIGSTNKPDSIDKAVLRAGRLEKWFYIPPPDFEARKAIFKLYLQDRPLDFGIDYERLATLTENYVSSDIKLLVDEASRKTIRDKGTRISMETLEFIIQHQKSTVPLSELKKYEEIRKKIEEGIGDSNANKRPRIGFNP